MNSLCKCNSELHGGNDKFTKNQIKKHYTQMNDKEKEIINKKIKEINDIKLSNHVIDYLKDNYFDFGNNDFKKYILNYLKRNNELKNDIIEFNKTINKYNGIDYRVLIRMNDDFYVRCKDNIIRMCNLCCVINLNDFKLVTMYFNRKSDKHKTLDYSRYDEALDIEKCLQINNKLN